MKKLTTVLLTVALLAFASAASAVPVNLELLLLVDVSSSIDDEEYELQKTGYINAFNNLSPGFATFAAAYAEWCSSGNQALRVGWTEIGSVADAQAFADDIADFDRSNFALSTSISAAVTWGVGQFNNNFEGDNLVMDVSGDGENNDPGPEPLQAMIDARNAVEAAGITINGLAINTTDFPNLDEYYEDYVITSDGFVIPAEGFEDFGRAVGRKITQEVTGEIPVPAAVWLLGSGLLGLAGLRLRRR